MARFRAARTAPVALGDLERGSAGMTQEQWAIVGTINRMSSVRDLAWRLRDALSRDPVRRDPLRRDPEHLDPVRRKAVPRQALPQRRPGASAAGGSPDEPEPSGEAGYSPPPPEVLTRVLDALREL